MFDKELVLKVQEEDDFPAAIAIVVRRASRSCSPTTPIASSGRSSSIRDEGDVRRLRPGRARLAGGDRPARTLRRPAVEGVATERLWELFDAGESASTRSPPATTAGRTGAGRGRLRGATSLAGCVAACLPGSSSTRTTWPSARRSRNTRRRRLSRAPEFPMCRDRHSTTSGCRSSANAARGHHTGQADPLPAGREAMPGSLTASVVSCSTGRHAVRASCESIELHTRWCSGGCPGALIPWTEPADVHQDRAPSGVPGPRRSLRSRVYVLPPAPDLVPPCSVSATMARGHPNGRSATRWIRDVSIRRAPGLCCEVHERPCDSGRRACSGGTVQHTANTKPNGL